MRAALIALMLSFATQAGAECGNLCDADWWKTATDADVQAELDAGADVKARNKFGHTPLLYAAEHGTPAIIQALLAAGADVMARTKFGSTALHSAALAGTLQKSTPYWTLEQTSWRGLTLAGHRCTRLL